MRKVAWQDTELGGYCLGEAPLPSGGDCESLWPQDGLFSVCSSDTEPPAFQLGLWGAAVQKQQQLTGRSARP